MKFLFVAILIMKYAYAEPRGDISFSYTKYLKEKEAQNNQTVSSSFQVQDGGEFLGLNYRFDVIGKVNATQSASSYLNANELNVNTIGPFGETYRVGYHVFNWSKLESFHPANVINANYIDSDLESFKKKGEFSLILDNEIILGNLKLYYFPFFEKNFYPQSQSRILDGTRPVETVYYQAKDEMTEKAVHQYGFSLQNNIGDFDFFAFAFKHIDRNNSIVGYDEFSDVPFVGTIPTGELSVIHSQVLDLGLAATYFWDVHTFKTEFVYSDFDSEIEILTTPGKITFVDQTKFALGYEYTHSFESGYDVTFFLEYQTLFYDKSVTILRPYELSVFQNDLFLGNRISFNDTFATELKFGLFMDVERSGEFLFFANFERRLNDMWKFKTSYRHIGFSDEDKNGLYLLKDDNEINFSLTRYF